MENYQQLQTIRKQIFQLPDFLHENLGAQMQLFHATVLANHTVKSMKESWNNRIHVVFVSRMLPLHEVGAT